MISGCCLIMLTFKCRVLLVSLCHLWRLTSIQGGIVRLVVTAVGPRQSCWAGRNKRGPRLDLQPPAMILV